MTEASLKITGPYEQAIVSVCELVGKIIDGQPKEVKEQMWKDYLDFVKPWNAIASQLNVQVAGAFEKLLKP
jgi:hypothetical protein